MTGEPIIVKIISESTGTGSTTGTSGGGGSILGGLSMNSPTSLLRSILGKLGPAALVAGPMLYFTKKIAENSELQKGFKKAIDAIWAEYGDIGIYFAWSVKNMADDIGGIPTAFVDLLKLWFIEFPVMYASFWIEQFVSLASAIGSAFNTAITKLTKSIFGDSTENEEYVPTDEQPSGAGKGGGSLKDWLLGQWYSFRRIFGFGPGPQIPVAEMFDLTGQSINLKSFFKPPNLNVIDLFHPAVQDGRVKLPIKTYPKSSYLIYSTGRLMPWMI
jgi:hypothetical protein